MRNIDVASNYRCAAMESKWKGQVIAREKIADAAPRGVFRSGRDRARPAAPDHTGIRSCGGFRPPQELFSAGIVFIHRGGRLKFIAADHRSFESSSATEHLVVNVTITFSVDEKVQRRRAMQEFIQAAASKLGINEDQAKSATGGVLNFLKSQTGDGEADSLIAKIPGAESVAQSAGSSSESGGGMLGGIGSKLGGAGGVLAALQGSGLDGGKAQSFVTMLVDYAKQKAGPEQVDRMIEKVPALKNFVQ